MKTMKNKYSFVSNNQQKGVSFIEVIVALVIIVTGILGAVAMQATAKKGSFDAMQRSLASSLAQDIIARMRAQAPSINPDLTLITYALKNYGEALDTVPDKRCNTVAVCNSTEMATNDRYEWELALMGGDTTLGSKNVGGLVGGRACIEQVGNAYTVVVSWQGRTKTVDAGAGSANCAIASGEGYRRSVIVQAFIF
jgi:type IV pilus assembly protein PilV